MGEEKYKYILKVIDDGEYLNNISSTEFLETIKLYSNNPEYRDLFIRNKKKIISYCANNFNLEDCLSLMFLKKIDDFSFEIKDLFKNTINSIFSKQTLIFLNRVFRLVEGGNLEIENIFDYIINELKNENSKKSSVILFDLCIFINFRNKLKEIHPLIVTIIMSYIAFDVDVVGAEMFGGSSIIGCLLKDNNEKLVMPYVLDLLEGKELDKLNVKMIGGGGSSLVFLINKLVLKLGETRNDRRIFVNHRILESKIRDLITKNDRDLFYIEVMNYAKTGDVTKIERDELRADLFRQGLIWEDDKLENCGVLQDDDTNDSYYRDMDLKSNGTIISVVDNPYDREQFLKRPRRVVVIDNDYIKMKPGGFSK